MGMKFATSGLCLVTKSKSPNCWRSFVFHSSELHIADHTKHSFPINPIFNHSTLYYYQNHGQTAAIPKEGLAKTPAMSSPVLFVIVGKNEPLFEAEIDTSNSSGGGAEAEAEAAVAVAAEDSSRANGPRARITSYCIRRWISSRRARGRPIACTFAWWTR